MDQDTEAGSRMHRISLAQASALFLLAGFSLDTLLPIVDDVHARDGYLLRTDAGYWVTLQEAPESMVVSWHCVNDRGLATPVTGVALNGQARVCRYPPALVILTGLREAIDRWCVALPPPVAPAIPARVAEPSALLSLATADQSDWHQIRRAA